jgi:predicted ester cyclase
MDLKRLVRKHFADLDNHDINSAVKNLDPRFLMKVTHAPETVRGRGGYRKLWNPIFGAFPDLRVKVLNLICEEDRVAVEILASGTFTRPYGKPPDSVLPTHRHVEFWWMAFIRVNPRGLIAEAHTYASAKTFSSVLGFRPEIRVASRRPISK